jgi:pimeloyl-ACP methyl ester carboxylesterase
MKYADSADGTRIAYTTLGDGVPALLFIHGGLADSEFWTNQVGAFSARYQTIALDLAGHGDSGRTREVWSMQAFGADVQAVLRAEDVKRAILIGNSLGGPVAAEAALQLPDRIAGIVAVDTFHELDRKIDPAAAMARVEMFRKDYAGSVREMTRMLFHPDADAELMAGAELRMLQTPVATAAGMFEAMAGYDLGAVMRRLRVPVRCINGDLFPVDFDANRRVCPDFDAVILPHTGHYPMLECPEEFNRRLAEAIAPWR